MELKDALRDIEIDDRTHDLIIDLVNNGDCVGAWQMLSKKVLIPSVPFDKHKNLFELTYKNSQFQPAPCWIPSDEEIAQTNISKLNSELGLQGYWDLHRWSITNREAFWQKLISLLGIQFTIRPKAVMGGQSAKSPDWLTGGMLNIFDSCIDETSEKNAVVYRNEGEVLCYLTYKELNAQCNRVANGLVKLGFKKGDAIAIDMIMTVDSVAIYLGILKAGCIAVSIADSLAPQEIKKRLDISNAKALFTQDIIVRGSKHLPLYEKVLQAEPVMVIVLSAGEKVEVSIRSQDILWEEFLSDNESFTTVPCHPMDTVNVLFSSGTTGEPKAIPWNHTTPIKCAADGYLHHDIQKEDVVSWPTNLGWMMGPWLIFATLINKGTIALYHGVPTSLGFVEFVRDAKVSMLGVVPSIVKQWRMGGHLENIDWSGIKNFSSTGESSNEDDMFWMMAMSGYKPVIEYCGGTEVGGGYMTGTMVQPAAAACFTTPALGLDLVILDESGERSNKGEVFIIPPSFGLSLTLLNKNHEEEYYHGTPIFDPKMIGSSKEKLANQLVLEKRGTLRRHGDEIEDINGEFFRAHGRVDDTMNLGGIKVSSVEIESILNQTNGVKETAAIAINTKGGPSELVVYVVLELGEHAVIDSLKIEMQAAIKMQLNPLFKIKEVQIIDTLPRTASNKVMRRTLRKEHLRKITQ